MLNYTNIKKMKTIKREILKLFSTFIEKTTDPNYVSSTYLQNLLTFLEDFSNNQPETRF